LIDGIAYCPKALFNGGLPSLLAKNSNFGLSSRRLIKLDLDHTANQLNLTADTNQFRNQVIISTSIHQHISTSKNQHINPSAH
jgi:hypothetical protein